MSAREPRFEIVHNPGEPQPWWGRFVAGNGRIVWTTETYHRRGPVIRAIEVMTGARVYGLGDLLWISRRLGVMEVREVEEATTTLPLGNTTVTR